MTAWEPVRPVRRGRTAAPDALTVYPIERLGNQLFTYAAAFAQARRLGVPCHVNLGFFEHARPSRTYSYAYELQIFDSGLVVSPDPSRHLPVFFGYPTVRGASFWHERVGRLLPGGPPVFMERGFTYDDRLRAVTPGTTVVGMFQSWRYFDEIGDELRERMTRLTQPSDWLLQLQDKLRPGQGHVGLHIRRGDYVLPEVQAKQGLARRGYYERALAHLRRVGLDGKLFVASDSFDLVRSEFAGLGDFEPIDPPAGVNPFEVVVAMSWLDGLVTANSSFSWWGAYLGQRPEQVVIAPRPWFTTPDLDTRDLLPPHWLTLDRDH